MNRKIIVLNGSPRSNGNTAALIRAFAAGAEAAGNTISVFNLAKMNIRGCVGCLAGGKDPASPCTQKDDMDQIYPVFRGAEVAVLASPLYYWSFTGQLKIVIDRLFALMEADSLNGVKTPPKDCAMLVAAEDSSAENFAPLVDYYHSFTGFLGWKDLGSVLAGGVLKIGDIDGRPELEQARKLGENI